MLRSKNLTKVLSLLLAIMLWAYVIVVENPPTTERLYNVPVELLNVGTLTQNGFAILEGENATVEVVVSGTRADILKYKDQVIATANVFGYRSGENYVTVDVIVPNSLTQTEVKPEKILVNIDNLVSVYKPVSISFTGEREPDTEPGSITMQPEQIEVKGPKSLVESVSYVGIEVPYSQLSRLGATVTATAYALDVNGEPVPKVNLSSNTVSVRATLYDTKEVPLNIDITGEVDGIYEMTQLDVPDTIIIRGSSAALADVEYIEAEPIDISGIDDTSELPVIPILPDGIEVANGSYDIHVNIGIKGISNLSFEYDSREIEIDGLGEGLTAYINTPAVTLKATGKETIINSALQEDFALSVDVTDKVEGLYVVPVDVKYDKELNNLEITPQEVNITISEDFNEDLDTEGTEDTEEGE